MERGQLDPAPPPPPQNILGSWGEGGQPEEDLPPRIFVSPSCTLYALLCTFNAFLLVVCFAILSFLYFFI